MSAIYQRARPISWEQVVGQEHVKDVLQGALEAGRVGHAYLFSGPRGVGKTTTARLIAMTANCQASGKKPCGECESCLSVRAGNHPDVLEIDAASNNSVDDVRDLREKVGLSAMRGGKKIYILDEAHMMSRAAFNALLKTLEEPPEHVIFILATTEPEKIIPTILSRCQHYRFRRLTAEEIAGKLAQLTVQEGARAEPEALQLIGRLADGAMRDGESLLERMLAAGQAVTLGGVEAALGLPPSERVRQMAQALLDLDAGPLLSGAAQLYRDGYAARTVVEGLVSALGAALHAELGLSPEGRLERADVPRLLRLQAALDAQEARFSRGADQLSLELALTHALIAGEGQPEAGAAPAPQRASPAQSGSLSADAAARLSKLEREVSALKAGGAPGRGAESASEIPAFNPAASRAPAAAPRAAAPVPSGGTWADVMTLANMQMRAFLKPARTHAEAGYASLSYDARGKFHAKQVYDKFDEVGALVLKVFGPVTFELISPDHNRKAKLGGAGAAPVSEVAATPEPEPEPAPRRPAPAARPAPPALDDIPDFVPTGRPKAAAAAPRSTPAAPPQADVPDDLPPFEPSARTARPVPIRPVPDPPSPDDAAPAPLPEAGTKTPPRTTELYIPLEPISQEPDWDDLGGPLETQGSVQTASPAPAPRASAPPPRAAAERPASRTPAPPGDVRAHPNYLEVTRLFSGRVKEIGKVKKTALSAADDSDDADDLDSAVDGAAEA
ncbi:hypothetical protein DKM44_11120 [Deinococcus irradiatisoli]|uniref:DNA polymerase III subunit gamma/tau n=1 Tax=Deinococcus irradiatisoli TaxID=2202254 RepID=A0A2Z3JFA2_9DEIO|nr:DNA polymerase III subunit gamma/tau [Deinococcus irradiatisoli]AWN23712.1 hypothetical protein DKM44_11120 [Deinococcus irradiatisoli]